MELMKWDESFSVQIKEIDDQHKKLVAMINKLHESMKDGKGTEVIGELLNEMAEYTVVHFETEEKYFDTFNYENADEHKAIHKAFVGKVVDFKKKFEEGTVALSVELMEFLVAWLKNHIQIEDRKYIECFHENGVS